MNKPKTLNDLNVRKLLKIQKIDPATLTGQKELIECIYNVKTDDMPIDEFLTACAEVVELMNSGDKSFKYEITIDGHKFTAKELNDFSTREFIDFDTLAKDSKENITTLLALIYDCEEFDSLDYIIAIKRKSEILMDMDAGAALGALDFFSKRLLSFVNNTLLSSEVAKRMVETNPEMKKAMNQIQTFLDGAGN